MGISIGIDLGTTNSASCIKKINVSAILNAEGEELTPSCVTAVPNTSPNFVVGRSARDLQKQYPEQTITSIKRLMGKDFEDPEVQNMISNYAISYPITTDPSEPGSVKIPLDGSTQTPEMISGMILRKLIHDGEKELQGKITEAVVTVPAYFSDRQKFATRAACDYAGIKLLRLLPEPTAAALSFGLTELNANESRTIMVFDLGGGTFDISVLNLSGGSFMETTKGGDMWLGGDNIDQQFIEYIYSQTQNNLKCAPITTLIQQLNEKDRARFLVEIKEKAEAGKIELSSQEFTDIELFGILKDENNKLIDINLTVTRAEFDKLIEPVVKRVSLIANQTLHEIRFEPELIDTVLMVGGTSLIPAIQDEVCRIFGKDKVHVHPRPMLAIAEGAALMAAKLAGRETIDNASFTLMHSTAHDYYLQLASGKRHLLVARNTPLPVTVEEKLSFTHADQALARLRVFNEVEGVLDTVGELWFHKEDADIKSNNKKNTELMLSFSVDEDNIITMKAWSLKNTQHCIESQIARGGLAAKLYNDLERTLSSIVANCENSYVEIDCLLLSRKIIPTILSASDPITGETRIENKQKAQRQITTLKALQEKNISTINMYDFALAAQKEAENIFTPEEKIQFDGIVARFAASLDALDDLNSFETIKKELDAFYENSPSTSALARAKFAAEDIELEHPRDAAELRRLSNKLIEMHALNDEDEIADAHIDLLYFLMSEFEDADNTPSRRFDKDVNF